MIDDDDDDDDDDHDDDDDDDDDDDGLQQCWRRHNVSLCIPFMPCTQLKGKGW